MGQRLNIEIVKGDPDNVLANAYYHWSAYTSSAAQLTCLIVAALAASDIEAKNDVDMAVKLLEVTGAGVLNEAENEINAFKSFGLDINEYTVTSGRNEGLISVSDFGKSETRSWEERRVQINIEHQTIYFGVLSSYTLRDWLLWYEGEESYLDLPQCSKWNLENCEFSFSEFIEFTQFVNKLVSNSEYEYYDLERERIISFIE